MIGLHRQSYLKKKDTFLTSNMLIGLNVKNKFSNPSQLSTILKYGVKSNCEGFSFKSWNEKIFSGNVTKGFTLLSDILIQNKYFIPLNYFGFSQSSTINTYSNKLLDGNTNIGINGIIDSLNIVVNQNNNDTKPIVIDNTVYPYDSLIFTQGIDNNSQVYKLPFSDLTDITVKRSFWHLPSSYYFTSSRSQILDVNGNAISPSEIKILAISDHLSSEFSCSISEYSKKFSFMAIPRNKLVYDTPKKFKVLFEYLSVRKVIELNVIWVD